MPLNEIGEVKTAARGLTANGNATFWMDPSGAAVVIDFFAKCVLDGKGYQVRAGTITTPLVGDVAVTNSAAEFCVDATSGLVVIPIFQNISVRLGTGTAHEYATKSAATVSSAGTAFVLLPMRSNGPTASLTARVSAAGGVTVTAELATTTLRHWSYSNPVAVGAGNSPVAFNWEPLRPPVLVGARCLYTQIAAATTGPSYYANLDILELTTGALGV